MARPITLLLNLTYAIILRPACGIIQLNQPFPPVRTRNHFTLSLRQSQPAIGHLAQVPLSYSSAWRAMSPVLSVYLWVRCQSRPWNALNAVCIQSSSRMGLLSHLQGKKKTNKDPGVVYIWFWVSKSKFPKDLENFGLVSCYSYT